MANQITPNPSVPSQVVAEVKFPKFINNLGIIPTSYKDSMSYYECLAWLCKFLEEQVIPTVNENGDAVQELQSLYIQLNEYVDNYFTNLDVQEEINNKLDEMVQDGELQELLSNLYQDLEEEVNTRINDIDNEVNTRITDVENDVNTRITNINNQVLSIASGSPKGVYSTAAALSSADPNHDYIYLVTADNKWYYYDGTQWTAGGLYNTTGINANSIEDYMTTFIKNSNNIFNKKDVTNDYYINPDNNATTSDNRYFYSNYIYINNSSTYYLSTSSSNTTPEYNIMIAYYDGEKTFISGERVQANGQLTIPSNTQFLILSARKTIIDYIMINIGSTVSNFEDYYKYINNLRLNPQYLNDKSITPEKTSFLNHTNNIIDIENVEDGYFVNYNSGIVGTNSDYYLTDFMPVESGSDYYIKNIRACHIAFYNDRKLYISGILYSSIQNNKITIPANCVYMRYSDRLSTKPSQMINKDYMSDVYIPNGYTFTDNIINENESKFFYCGSNREFTELKNAIEFAMQYPNSILYVDEGEYDLYEEFGGDTFFNNFSATSPKGIFLGNGIKIIFDSNSKVVCKNVALSTAADTEFSPFNAGLGNFEIENMTIETSRVRYCVHDEKSSSSDKYKHRYINCHFIHDNTNGGYTQGIGGGLGHNGEVEVLNCIFENPNALTTDYLLSYHNNISNSDLTAKNNVILSGNYLKQGRIKASYAGASTNITTFLISNNRSKNTVNVIGESGFTNNNIEVFQYNNIVE